MADGSVSKHAKPSSTPGNPTVPDDRCHNQHTGTKRQVRPAAARQIESSLDGAADVLCTLQHSRSPLSTRSQGPDRQRYRQDMADEFDVTAMIDRFRTRAKAVRERGIPPIEGPERRRFMEQAQVDYMDYAMLGDAEGSVEDGILVLRVDLRPADQPQPS